MSSVTSEQLHWLKCWLERLYVVWEPEGDDAIRALLAEHEELLQTIEDSYFRCACIKNLPGDNYTCTHHEKLWKLAHARYYPGKAWDAAKEKE